jgi:peptide chain release factor 3
MEVCRMRNTPVICFINKLDREGRDPYDLLDEVETKLGIKVRPLSWPIGMGKGFKGVYNLYEKKLNLFTPSQRKLTDDRQVFENLDDPQLDALIGPGNANQLREDVDLIEGVYPDFDVNDYLEGKIAPVFFGSAVNNFGVNEMLDTFIKIAPTPKSRATDVREVNPEESKFSGFVFKIHANMDPNHRNRIAFLRICSGKFERNTFYYHTRTNKKLKFANPATFMANEKILTSEAYPGDVIGLYDSGNFKIGDTLTEGENLHFKGIPSFSPEIFKELENRDPMKTKQLEKGISQLSEEGVAQLFIQNPGNRKIIGTVGELQFEVIQFRLEHEYGAKCAFIPLKFWKAFWITCSDKKMLETFMHRKAYAIVHDKEGNPVFLAESEWNITLSKNDFPDIEFHTISE